MRSKLLVVLGVLVALSMLAACAPATPEVIEVVKEVPVEKIVKETVVVEKEVAVEKVVKETVVVEKEVKVEVTAAPEKKEPVTITWWTDPAFADNKTWPECKIMGDYEKMIAAEYMKTHPWVTVEVQAMDWADLPKKVPAAVAAGVPPDIMKDYLGRSSGYAWEGGILENMEEILPQAALDDILPGMVDLYTIEGHLHGFPAYFWEVHMTLNYALFEEAGLTDMLPLDDHDWTFAEFRAAAEAIQAAGVDYAYADQVASEQGDYGTHSWIWGAGSNTWRDDCQGLDLDNDAALEAFTFLNDLYQDGLMNPDATTAGWQDVNNLFFTGKAAFLGGSGLNFLNVSMPNAIAEGKVPGPMDARITMYPHAEGVSQGLPAGPTSFFVFKKEDRTDYELGEIVDFLLYINGEKWLRDACLNNAQFPALKSVSAPLAGDPNYEMVLNWVAERGTESMGLQCPHFAEVRAAMPAFFQAMFLGQMTPQEAIDGMMEMSADIFGQ